MAGQLPECEAVRRSQVAWTTNSQLSMLPREPVEPTGDGRPKSGMTGDGPETLRADLTGNDIGWITAPEPPAREDLAE
jgi:hypothetical protein